MPESVRALIADHVQEAERAQAKRARPVAVASREATNDQFSGQTPAEAKVTFEDSFAAVAEAPAYSVDEAVQDGHVTKVTGEREAQVAMNNGSKGVLVSAQPLKVSTPSGPENVDATLQSDGDAYVPEAPRARYTVAKDLTQGVELTEAGVSIAPVGPGVDAAKPQRVGDSVMWANAAADTDFVVSPLPNGVETFHQVRSQDAPESFPLAVTVPDGGKVVRSTELPQALDVQDGDGRVVAQLSPAIAQDADGVNVPASYSVDEATNRVTINVPHRDEDVRYPILVDPSFSVWELLEDPSSAGNYPGWTYEGNDWVSHKAGWGYWGWGIYGWMAADQSFGFADMARWLFRAPGDSTVAAATLRGTYYTAAQHSCMFEGIANAAMTAFDSGMTALTNGTDLSTNPYITCAAGYDASFANNSRGLSSTTKSPGNAALFAITAWSPGATVPASSNVDLTYLASSDVVIEDSTAPTVAATYQDGHIVFDVQDSGTGVKHADTSVNGASFVSHSFDCSAESAPNWGCHHQRNVEVANAHSGDHLIIDAYDEAGNKHTSAVTLAYWTSIQYGGPDWHVNTPAEQDAAAAALVAASSGSVMTLWDGLLPADKQRMISDSSAADYDGWVSRIDTVAPSMPAGVVIDEVNTADSTANISFGPGTDPDLEPGVQGSGIDTLKGAVRWKHDGGSWGYWSVGESLNGVLTGVAPGDHVTVEVAEYDQAGNISAVRQQSLVIPDDDSADDPTGSDADLSGTSDASANGVEVVSIDEYADPGSVGGSTSRYWVPAGSCDLDLGLPVDQGKGAKRNTRNIHFGVAASCDDPHQMTILAELLTEGGSYLGMGSKYNGFASLGRSRGNRSVYKNKVYIHGNFYIYARSGYQWDMPSTFTEIPTDSHGLMKCKAVRTSAGLDRMHCITDSRRLTVDP